MNKSKRSFLLVPTASSKKVHSQSPNVDLEQSQVLSNNTNSLANDMSAQSTERLELLFPGACDSSEELNDIAFTAEGDLPTDENSQWVSLPEQNEDSDLATTCSVAPDSQSETSNRSIDVLTKMSPDPESTPSSPESGSPQLDQLLSDLEGMKFNLQQETTNPPSLETTGNSEVDQSDKLEDLSVVDPESRDDLEDPMSPDEVLDGDDHTSAGTTEPTHFHTSAEDDRGKDSVVLSVTKTSETAVPSSIGFHEDSPVSPTSIPTSSQAVCEDMEPTLTSRFCDDMFQDGNNIGNAPDIFPSAATESQIDTVREHPIDHFQEDYTADIVQTQEELQPLPLCNDLKDTTEETSTESNQNLYLMEASSVETYQSEDYSSQSLSDMTPETVTTARHFSFEELMQFPSSRNSTSSDEDKPRDGGQLSVEALIPADHEYFQSTSVISKPELTSSTSDEEYSINSAAEVSSTSAVNTHIPPRYSEVVNSSTDSPTFDYSDPEPFFDCKQAASDFSEPEEAEARAKSSGMKPLSRFRHLRGPENNDRRVLLSSGSEDYEDATFVHEPFHHVDSEELLHYSASDEEFILCEASQPPPVCEIGPFDDTDKSLAMADEFPDLPAQSVTEEKYTDENGHVVVKKVTRKIIRKCVSADGVEHEETSEGAEETMEGAGYSKVVKRTVVKSVGDHTEVTFTECEGLSSTNQEIPDGRKLSCTEKTTVVEGERTSAHQGDPALASDLPSAQDDFKQALSYLKDFSASELPPVVETETVREDGTMVRRAHVRKGQTRRRTVVRGPGQHRQVLTEQVDGPRNGSNPRDLQQHLHQLFHRYCEEEREEDSDDEDEGTE
ncbi:ankyrin-2-like isoform X2 [Salarias fasciatus]|uniref:ankyrin-2-like isoform X2 n=1 Tax=Salarias fasciatus TaxID=181472 RepID=UPI001176F79F|nr:ankyrin-2-like isoform X2 [Salarias fasciatus]